MHAILINKQFTDETYPTTKKIFAQKTDGSWEIYGIEIDNSEIDTFITELQTNMRPNEPWYAHIYNDEKLIVVFKEKVITATPHISTWQPIFNYAKTLNIPEKQLDFWPNRYQDERHYFTD